MANEHEHPKVSKPRHGRRALGIELNEEYIKLAHDRIVGDMPLFNTVGAL